MPIAIKLGDHGTGVVMKTVSPVSGDEIVGAIESFLRDEWQAFQAVRYWYSDHREAGVMDANSDHAWQVAARSIQAARANRGLVVAICAPTSSAFVLSEVWKSLAQETGWEIQVFRGEAEAKAWLRARLGEELDFA